MDVLVNAAGVCRVGRLETLDEEELINQLQLNVIGTSLLTRLFAKGESTMSGHKLLSLWHYLTIALSHYRAVVIVAGIFRPPEQSITRAE